LQIIIGFTNSLIILVFNIFFITDLYIQNLILNGFDLTLEKSIEKRQRMFYTEENRIEDENDELDRQYSEIVKLQREEEEEDAKLSSILNNIQDVRDKEILSNFLKNRDKKRMEVFTDISLKMSHSLEKLIDVMEKEAQEDTEKYGPYYIIDHIDSLDEDEKVNLNFTEEEINQFRKEKMEEELRIKNHNIDIFLDDDQEKNKEIVEINKSFDNLFNDMDESNKNLDQMIEDLDKKIDDIDKKEKKFYTISKVLLNGKKEVLQLIRKIGSKNKMSIYSSFRYRNLYHTLKSKISLLRNNNVVSTFFRIQKKFNIKIKVSSNNIKKLREKEFILIKHKDNLYKGNILMFKSDLNILHQKIKVELKEKIKQRDLKNKMLKELEKNKEMIEYNKLKSIYNHLDKFVPVNHLVIEIENENGEKFVSTFTTKLKNISKAIKYEQENFLNLTFFKLPQIEIEFSKDKNVIFYSNKSKEDVINNLIFIIKLAVNYILEMKILLVYESDNKLYNYKVDNMNFNEIKAKIKLNDLLILTSGKFVNFVDKKDMEIQILSVFSLFGYLIKIITDKNIVIENYLIIDEGKEEDVIDRKIEKGVINVKTEENQRGQEVEKGAIEGEKKLMNYKPYSQQYTDKKFKKSEVKNEVKGKKDQVVDKNDSNVDTVVNENKVVVDNLTQRYNELKKDVKSTQLSSNDVLEDTKRLEEVEIKADIQKLTALEMNYDAQRLKDLETTSKSVTKVKENEPPTKD
jgi:hypothetical protein